MNLILSKVNLMEKPLRAVTIRNSSWASVFLSHATDRNSHVKLHMLCKFKNVPFFGKVNFIKACVSFATSIFEKSETQTIGPVHGTQHIQIHG